MNRLKVSTRLILGFGLLALIGIVIAVTAARKLRSGRPVADPGFDEQGAFFADSGFNQPFSQGVAPPL